MKKQHKDMFVFANVGSLYIHAIVAGSSPATSSSGSGRAQSAFCKFAEGGFFCLTAGLNFVQKKL